MMNGHPLQAELTRRYRLARAEWARTVALRDTARLFGMSERQYCDAYVCALHPMTYTVTATTANWHPPAALDFDRAYRDAKVRDQ